MHYKMKKIRLIDGCFPGNPSSIAGDNVWRGPQHFEWDRGSGESLYTWFTNWTLRDVTHGHLRPRIAWLLEPPSINFWPYVVASEDRNKFDAIMTYDKHLLESGDSRFKFAPHGGSWIDWDLWGMHEKTKDVCMIVSDKKDSVGHKLRHEIAKEFSDVIDIYGPSFQTFDRKWDVLRHYRYCVVVESVKMDFYFSEKLIDAISVGCIPVYWGCPEIIQFFDTRGIISFQEIRQMGEALGLASAVNYRNQKSVLISNIEKAKQYRMPEDWMFEHYPELFR